MVRAGRRWRRRAVLLVCLGVNLPLGRYLQGCGCGPLMDRAALPVTKPAMMMQITEALEGRMFRRLVGTGTHTIRGRLGEGEQSLGSALAECAWDESREGHTLRRGATAGRESKAAPIYLAQVAPQLEDSVFCGSRKGAAVRSTPLLREQYAWAAATGWRGRVAGTLAALGPLGLKELSWVEPEDELVRPLKQLHLEGRQQNASFHNFCCMIHGGIIRRAWISSVVSAVRT